MVVNIEWPMVQIQSLQTSNNKNTSMSDSEAIHQYNSKTPENAKGPTFPPFLGAV